MPAPWAALARAASTGRWKALARGWALALVPAVLLGACGGGHAKGPVIIPGAGVPGTELQAGVRSLCQAVSQATSTPAGGPARDTFYVQAHQRLHLEAQALAEVDRPAAARLLVDIQRVEADLTPNPAAPALAPDLATLTQTAADGLARLAVAAPPCARP